MTKWSFIRALAGFTVSAVLTVIILYLSRFWIWKAPWGNEGLFGQNLFSPNGNAINGWLGGTWIQDFDILIWGAGALVALSLLQRLKDRLFS